MGNAYFETNTQKNWKEKKKDGACKKEHPQKHIKTKETNIFPCKLSRTLQCEVGNNGRIKINIFPVNRRKFRPRINLSDKITSWIENGNLAVQVLIKMNTNISTTKISDLIYAAITVVRNNGVCTPTDLLVERER